MLVIQLISVVISQIIQRWAYFLADTFRLNRHWTEVTLLFGLISFTLLLMAEEAGEIFGMFGSGLFMVPCGTSLYFTYQAWKGFTNQKIRTQVARDFERNLKKLSRLLGR